MTGLLETDVEAAIQALVHAGFLHENRGKVTRNGAGDLYVVLPGWLIPSERGRRTVGLRPSKHTVLDQMLAQLAAIAKDSSTDEDTCRRARRILESFADAGKQIGLSVASAVITGQVT